MAVALGLMLLVLGLYWKVFSNLREARFNDVENDAHVIAQLVETTLYELLSKQDGEPLEEGLPAVQRVLTQWSRSSEKLLQIELYNESSIVIVHSNPQQIAQSVEPEHRAMIEKVLRRGRSVEHIDGISEQLAYFIPFDFSEPMPALGGSQSGVIEVVLDLEYAYADIRNAQKVLLVFSFLVGCLVLGILYVLFHHNRCLYSEIERRRRIQKELLEHKLHLEEAVQERTVDIFRKKTELRKEIAEREAAQKELENAKAQAESSFQSKSEFLSLMSHEMKTPLNPILGMSEMLMMQAQDKEQKEMLSMIFEGAKQLESLVKNIVEVARIDTNQNPLNLEWVRVDACFRSLLESVLGKAEDKKIHAKIQWHDPLPQLVEIDSARLQQMVWNLLDNAIKFTEPEGKIVLCVETDWDESETSVNSLQNILLRIRVMDTGCGICASHIEKIFEPFYQADAGLRRQYGGAGLGLTVVRRLGNMMQATVQAENTHNGAVFEIRLPVRAAQSIPDAVRDLPAGYI